MRILTTLVIVMGLLLSNKPVFGQLHENSSDVLSRKQRVKERRDEFRKTNQQYFFKFGAVNANLDTDISFDLVDGLISAQLGLENNLGLPGKRTFFTASFVHRFTPTSGMYVNYYGINRSETRVTNKDLIFGKDTIPMGTATQAFFNTHVISAGYLFTLVKDPDAFLGVYFNIYLMGLSTGVKSDIGDLEAKISYAVPLPNFGLVGMFKLKNWLFLDGNVGFFTLDLEDFEGTIYDFSARLVFKPTNWLGLSIDYQKFDIRVKWPYDGILTTVDYNFRGPGLGAILSF